MKILFIWPNYDCPIGLSIGVSYLSAILKEHGYQTNILHISEILGRPFLIDELLVDIEKCNPDIIAISTGENHYNDMEELCKFPYQNSYWGNPCYFECRKCVYRTKYI